jgi:2-polyprenyl-3-methyl-5-hydroxy-6-metoxy-1,4-benzoquinol methylase
MGEFKYVGSELDLFAAACNWKAYWASQLRPFLRGDILEVGAGIGSNAQFLHPTNARRWVRLEPDPELKEQLVKNSENSHAACEIVCGRLEAVRDQKFDAIIYIDVLEHIEDDRGELSQAASHLRVGGYLIVLAPAHQFLFSPFDAAIGHFRRYNRRMLRAITPTGLRLERIRYLDSVGVILSVANVLLLRQSLPTKDQLRIWDSWLVPVSRNLDKLFLYSIGKTILAVWLRPASF